MTSIQKVLIKLLGEIEGICKDNGLSFYLTDKLAWDAYKFHKFHDKTYEACIAMPLEDLKVLIKLVEDIDNRTIESWDNNPNLSTLYFRYVAEDTLLLDLNLIEELQCFGIALEIRPLLSCSLSQNEQIIRLEELNNAHSEIPQPDNVIAASNDARESKEAYAKQVYHLVMSSDDTQNDQSVLYKTKDFREIEISNPKMLSKRTVVLESKHYPVFGNVEEFFEVFVASDWRNRKYNRKVRREQYNVIAAVGIPYEVVMLEYREKGYLDSSWLEKMQELDIWDKKIIQPMFDKMTEERQPLWAAADRVDLWEKYLPLKDRVSGIRQESNYELLDEVLQNYVTKILEYYPYGIPLYFDKDYYAWAIESLERRQFAELDSLKELYEQANEKELTEHLASCGIDVFNL